MPQPLVSISIITFNQINFIHETLYSALDQDYKNLEVVVADDGSTDGTAEVILEYAKKYPGRLIPLVGGPNLGITGNSNRALKACRGKYIAFQGGDDVLLPGKIIAQVEWFEKDSKRVLCYHDVDAFDSETGKTIRKWSDRFKHRACGVDELVRLGPFMCATSVMIRRDLSTDVMFDHRIPVASDWLFWVEVLVKNFGLIGFVNGTYARYRRHDGNVTNHSLPLLADSLKSITIIEEKFPWLSKECRNHRSIIYLRTAKHTLLEKKIISAAILFAKSFLPRNGFGFLGMKIYVKWLLNCKL